MDQIDSEWHQLDAVKRDILVALALEGPIAGADVQQMLDCGAEDRPSGAWIDRQLVTLRDEGYVEGQEDPDDRRRIVNALTADGVALVKRGIVHPARELEELGVKA